MKGYAELGQRSRPNTNDLRLSLSEFGFSVADLAKFVEYLKDHRMSLLSLGRGAKQGSFAFGYSYMTIIDYSDSCTTTIREYETAGRRQDGFRFQIRRIPV